MKCRNCGQEIHPQSKNCFYCGALQKKGLSTGAVVAITLGSIAFALLLFFGSFIGCVVCISSGSNAKSYSSITSDTSSATEVTEIETEKETATEPPTKKPTEPPTEAPTEPLTEKSTVSENDFKNSCATIDYTTLSRNPDKYKENNYVFTGEVIQVQESSWSDTVDLRINVTQKTYEYIDDTYYTDTVYCTVEIPDGEDRILEDDIITFWGTCDGLYSYTSILGSSVSLPKIDIKYFQIND